MTICDVDQGEKLARCQLSSAQLPAIGIVSPKPSSPPRPVMGIPGPDTDIALHKVKPLREKQAGPPHADPAQAGME